MAQSRNQLSFELDRTGAYRGRSLTYDLLDTLLENLRKASYLDTACAASGVTFLTVCEWLKRGKDWLERLEAGQVAEYQLLDQDIIRVDAYLEITKCLADSEIKDLEKLEELIEEGDFRALKFKLERRAPERWGKRDHLTIESGEGMRVSQEPRIVDYSSEIEQAEEFKMLNETFEPASQVEDVEIIHEEMPNGQE